MIKRIAEFYRKEDGAVTVDWVVLTAAIVALGVAVGFAMTTSATSLSDDIWAFMEGLGLYD